MRLVCEYGVMCGLPARSRMTSKSVRPLSSRAAANPWHPVGCRSEPDLVTDPTFAALGLAEPLLRALTARKFTTPTPIQAEAIPVLLANQDLLGIAQTGSGKTAAFTLPILQHLGAQPVRPAPFVTRALILAPTRELALQIDETVRALSAQMRIRTVVIIGGASRFRQVEGMRRGADIVIGTPGRVCDLMQTRELQLGAASRFVLDEADRMLDLGFIKDIRRIVAALPAQRQSALFSATMPAEVASLAAGLLHEPVRVEIARKEDTAPRIDQFVHHVTQSSKQALLLDLLRDHALSRVIVFTRTKHGANKVAGVLENAGIQVNAIHGNKSQSQRERALRDFRTGRARVLVATDIAARGIDVTGISHVINFDLPAEPESYVHRIGRTARAGAAGVAISFCDPAERSTLRIIERLTGAPLSVTGDAPPAPAQAKRPVGANHARRRFRDGRSGAMRPAA
jgi:ATP-dependent RNA helicase RhlE